MFKRKAKEKKIKTPRFQTFRDAYKVTKQVKPWIPAALIGIFLATWAIGIGIGASLDPDFLLFCFSLAKQDLLLTLPLKGKWVRAQAF
jgi:hypothetical protein